MNKLGTKVLKVISAISVVSMCILIGLNLLIFKMEFSKLQIDAKNSVIEAAKIIDGDKLEKVISSKSMDIPEYKEIQEAMIRFKNDKDIKYIYTMAKGTDNSTFFIVDGALTNPNGLGEKYNLEKEMQSALDGQAAYTKKPITDDNGTFISAYAPIKNSSGKIIAFVGADKDVATFVGIRHLLLISIAVASVVIIILSILSSAVFSKRITSNVEKIRESLKRMAAGDLKISLNIKSRDEFESIAEAINDFRVNFSDSMRLIKDEASNVGEHSEKLTAIAEEMTAASEVCADSVQGIANSATYQTEEFDSISNTLIGFSSKIDSVAKIIDNVNDKMSIIGSKTKTSNEDLEVLQNVLGDISLSFNNVSEKIKNFGRQLSKINEITGLINVVADQTNLIALNASIEAARAGEAGRGFTVVAEEIRKLAEQSKVSSSNINNLIQNISGESNLIIGISEKMNSTLNEEVEIINKSLSSFRDIISNIEEVCPQIELIAHNVNTIEVEKESIVRLINDAAQNAEEISASAQQISASAQESSASSQEVAQAAQSLNANSQLMIDSISQFKI